MSGVEKTESSKEDTFAFKLKVPLLFVFISHEIVTLHLNDEEKK